MGYEVQDFEKDVIQQSATRPVLVDFWAPWCGPCRTLGPVIEKLAEEQADRWSLVKVNSDEHPDLSRRYGIRGIPAVKLFVDGEVADDFTGALPEYAIRRWLDETLPDAGRNQLADAEELLDENRNDEARELLEEILEENPSSAAAAGHLARLLVFEDPERAADLAETAATGDSRFAGIADAVRDITSFFDRDLSAELNGEDAADIYREAVKFLQEGDIEGALNGIIMVLQKNRYLDDDGPRRLGVSIFSLLGEDHALTRKYRRTFDMWLY